jgi:hypothetical protein
MYSKYMLHASVSVLARCSGAFAPTEASRVCERVLRLKELNSAVGILNVALKVGKELLLLFHGGTGHFCYTFDKNLHL